MFMYNLYFKVSEKQSTIGYTNRCDNKYSMTVLADACMIFDDNKHYKLCVGDAACAIMTMANGTYYMFGPHSHDMTGFKKDSGALV